MHKKEMKVVFFFAITHWLNSEVVKYLSRAVRPHN